MIETGAPWPPDAERIKRYQDYENLYDGDHEKVSVISTALDYRIKKQGPDMITYLKHGLPKVIVNIVADLEAGAAPVISYEEKNYAEALADILEKSHFAEVMLEICQDKGFRGDGVFCVDGKEGDVIIRPVPAYTYFPEIDPDNCRNVLSECLAWERDWDGDTLVMVDRFSPGMIRREAYYLEGEKLGAQLSDDEVSEIIGRPVEIRTGLEVSTLVHIPNTRQSNDYFGQSDYDPALVSLFDEYNERSSQTARILDSNAAPKMTGPKVNAGPDGVVRIGNYIENMGGAEVKYLTWDGQLQSSFQHQDKVFKAILAYAQVAEVLLMQAAGARYDSGPAFRIQVANTLAKRNRKLTYTDPRLKKAIRIAVALWLGMKYEDVPMPNVKWLDGLPKDSNQDAQTEVALVAAKITSRHSAIMRQFNCDEATANAELAKMEAEQEKFGGAEPPPPPQQIDPESEEPGPEMDPGSFDPGSEE